jgi:nucleoside-diphosphate-sugar epimerase
MTIAVIGATSQIGHFLLPRLRMAGYEVIGVSRRSHADEADVSWRVGYLPDTMPTLPAVKAIISFGPIDHLAWWLSHTDIAGIPQIIATSSMSAESKRESSVPAERELSERLREAERVLAAQCARRGLAWTVLRPTLVYGAGMDNSLTPLARRAVRQRVFALPAGHGLRQPVHADDLAQAAFAALGNAQAHGHVLSIGGGERLTVAQVFARVRASLPVATLPVPVPECALKLAAFCLPRFRGALNRLQNDLIADNSELERVLGIHPRPFTVDASCWRL